VVGAIALSAINSYLLPDVLYSLPRRVGLDFDFSAIASGVYGAIILFVMLLRPQGLVPEQWPRGDAGGGDERPARA
jgi:branched-chain amino acid transport system permease protein